MASVDSSTSGGKAYIVTGPTSGFGRKTAIELARHGTVVLVDSDSSKLDDVQREIERPWREGGLGCLRPVGAGNRAARGRADHRARSSGRRTAQQRGHHADPPHQEHRLGHDFCDRPSRPIRAHRNPVTASRTARRLCSSLRRRGSRAQAGGGRRFPRGRYISAEAGARGEWEPGGCKIPGGDAYATSKQCTLATVFVFARETRGYASTPSSPASARAPISAVTAMDSSACWRSTGSRRWRRSSSTGVTRRRRPR